MHRLVRPTLFLLLGALIGYFVVPHLLEPDHWHELEHMVGTRQASAAEADYNVIVLGPEHDWTQGRHKHDPPCGQPLPCVGDFHGTIDPDLIRGEGGWDWGFLGGGGDIFEGGRGMDQPYGGAGNDDLDGGLGHDHEWGGGGDDLLKTSDGEDEPGHIEEIHGGFGKNVEPGVDRCVMDEDPVDGIAVTDCDTLVLQGVPGVSGGTPLYRNSMAFEQRRNPVGFLHGPDVYRNVGE